jgi:hypothetical protein
MCNNSGDSPVYWSSSRIITTGAQDMNRRLSGVALATAAALAFSTVAVTSAFAADEAKVKCEGVNSCKGTSACATASNACAGQNSCKGHGFLELTKAECDAAKAKLEKEKS